MVYIHKAGVNSGVYIISVVALLHPYMSIYRILLIICGEKVLLFTSLPLFLHGYQLLQTLQNLPKKFAVTK